jgi:hypothetical protein
MKDQRELKDYNASGISFSYPAEYTLKSVNLINSTFLVATASNKSFNISKSLVNSSFEDYKMSLKKNLTTDYFVKDEVVNINGLQAYQITYIPIAPLGVFYPRNTIIFLDKNSTRYKLTFSGEGTLKDIPLIEKSLQIY